MRTFVAKKIKAYWPALISGLALIFSFPRFDISPLAWIALAPFLVFLHGKKHEEAFRIGFIMGIPYFLGTLYWIYHSINHYGNIPFVVSIALVLLLCMYLSLYTGFFALLFSWKINTTRLPALFLAPVFWVTLEFLRSYALTGFPWSSIGYSQYRFLPEIQIADITGIYGVSFLVVAINGAIADFFILRKRVRDMPLFSPSPTLIGVALLSVVVMSVLGYGYWRLHKEVPGKQVRISVVQGNIEQDKKWDLAYQREVLDTYKDLSMTAQQLSPSLIVWPETAVPFYFNADKEYTNELVGFQEMLQTHLLFGSIMVKEPSKQKREILLTNSSILLDPEGTPVFTYDKLHLVPFGEYVPLRHFLFFVDKLVEGIGDYVPGEHQLKAETPFGSFGVFICYEIIFPGLVRKPYSKGGSFIVNITNDAWFGNTAGPYQHFSMAVFRAIENRKPVVRAANTGISGFIASDGRILSTTRLFQRTTLTTDIQTNTERSFYARFGDLFAYLCIVMTVLLILNLSRR